MLVARYSPPARSSVSDRTASRSRSRTPGAIDVSNAASMSITIGPFRSNSASSSGVFTSRAARVTGRASRSVAPSRCRARNPGVPSRSTATTSVPAPSSRSASIVSLAHAAASSSDPSTNSQARIGRTSSATSRERWIEFGCSNRIGRPETGTTAQRTKVLMLQTGIADAPVAYRMFGSWNRTHAPTPASPIACCSRSSRPARRRARSMPSGSVSVTSACPLRARARDPPSGTATLARSPAGPRR